MAIRLNIITAFDDKELKRAQREIAAVGKSLSRGLDMVVTGAVAGATAGLVGAVKASSDYLAQMTGVEQVFGSAAKSVADFSENAAKSAGLSATEALTAAKTFGLFANSAGLAGEASATFATTLTQLAGDLGSFNEIPTAQVLADIQSGLQGQAEPLRKYGIFLTDAKLKEEAKNLAIYQGTGALSDQQKMLASYSLILKSTKVQQGDFAKYSTDLGNSTKTLTATFADLQVEIGNAVRPALAEIIPVLQEMIPLLGEQLKGAVESVNWKDFFTAIVNGVGFIVTHLKEIATFVATVWAMSAAFRAVTTAIKIATAAQALFAAASVAIKAVTTAIQGATAAQLLFNIAQAATPWGLIALGIGAIATAWILGAEAAKQYRDASADATDVPGVGKGGAPITPKGKDGKALTLGEYNKTTAGTKPKVTDTVADPLADLKKQLEALKTTTDTVKKANTTAADAAKKAADARAKAIADAKQLADEAKRAFDDLKKAIENFNTSFAKTATAFREVFSFSAPLGKFESQAVDAFQTMKDAAQQAFDNGLITKNSLAELKAYADKESALLVGIAKDRDQLAKKISIAESVTAGVMGSLNITSMLESQTKQVTKSVTKMVNGIALTTTQTFDEVVSGGLASSFKKLVDKTKAFATNLIALKKLGLNGQLFKQIVEGGAEAGGATAEAILAGGADTVKELNGLFKDLTDAGASIAETATPVMYDLGENMTNSFIDGLRSQDQMLIATANSMAALFTNQFKSMLDVAITPGFTQGATAAKMNMDSSDFIRGYGRVTSTGTSVNGGNITVQVNAGVIANKQELPQIIVDALGTYTKQSGSGGLTRVLGL